MKTWYHRKVGYDVTGTVTGGTRDTTGEEVAEGNDHLQDVDESGEGFEAYEGGSDTDGSDSLGRTMG